MRFILPLTVGGAQLDLPAHVINEYSRFDRSFDPCPEFKEASLPRIGVNTWRNPPENICPARETLDQKLGSLSNNFATLRGSGRDPGRWRSGCDHSEFLYCSGDLVALKKLYTVRIEQFDQLISTVKLRSYNA